MKKRKSNNPNHTKNLKPFKKGKDSRRNLKGAPKGVSVSQYIRQLSEEEIDMTIRNSSGQTIKVERHTRAKAIAMRLYELAMKGSEKAASKYMEIILERTEGKVTQPIEVKSKLDLSKLSSEELNMLRKIHSKATAGAMIDGN